jgi:hypothetical protein
VADRVCPRCASAVLPPTLLHHEFRCPQHGDVAGLGPAIPFDPGEASVLTRRSQVPIWFPQPMPAAWLLTGLRWAETPRGSAPAVAVGFSGHGLSHGPTDVVIVAEQPGCGLGAAFAGLEEPDPGPDCFAGTAAARIHTGHRSTGLWSVQAPNDRVAFVGEADGDWLWIIGWPQSAWGLVADDLRLSDGRVDGSYRNHRSGALNPRLADGGTFRGSHSSAGLRPRNAKA